MASSQLAGDGDTNAALSVVGRYRLRLEKAKGASSNLPGQMRVPLAPPEERIAQLKHGRSLEATGEKNAFGLHSPGMVQVAVWATGATER